MTRHLCGAALIGATCTVLACQPPTPVVPTAGGTPAVITGTVPVGLQPTSQAARTIPVGRSPHGMAGVRNFVYNANVGDATISVIDARTDVVVKTIPITDGKPGYVHAFRDKYVVVTDTLRGTVMVFDPDQDHKLVQTVPVGSKPDKLRMSADGFGVFVSLTGESKIVMLTFLTDVTQAPTRRDLAIGTNPGEHRALDVEAGWALAPNGGDNNASLVNLADFSVKTLVDGNVPGPVAIAATAEETAVSAIVGNTASNTITLFGIPGGEKTTLSNVGLTPTDIAVHPKLGRAFVSMAGSNDLAVIDYGKKELASRVGMGARPVHVYLAPKLDSAAPTPLPAESPHAAYAVLHADAELSNEVWVGNDGGDSVTILDADTLRVLATIGCGKGHHKMAFANGKGYVSNITDGTVSVIDRAALK